MKRENKKMVTGIIVVILIVIAICTKNESIINYVEKNYDINLGINLDNKNADESSEINKIECKVIRVVDGDTIVVNYNEKEEKVRLIGIDTPESVHPNESKNSKEGIKVSDYTKKRLSDKTVKLELDVQERDKYGRILAYVYVDEEMYNKELLKIGYAKLATYPPNVKYVDDFTKLQEEARENKVGLWK